MLDHLQDIIYNTGIYQYGFINPALAEYHQMVRDICNGNTCGQYARSWACPPAVGTVQECRNRCLQYDTMMVFSGLFPVAGPFDTEGIKNAMTGFNDIVIDLDSAIGPALGDHLTLSNEGCNRCQQCTWPNDPCRFPELLHHSIEGYGFLVSDLAKMAGIAYENGENILTFFGALLFNSTSLPEQGNI